MQFFGCILKVFDFSLHLLHFVSKFFLFFMECMFRCVFVHALNFEFTIWYFHL